MRLFKIYYLCDNVSVYTSNASPIMLINGHWTLCLNKRAQSLKTATPSVYGRKTSTSIEACISSRSKYNNASCTMALTQLRIRCSFSLQERCQLESRNQ